MSFKYGKIGRSLGLGLALFVGATSQGMAQDKASDKGQLFQMGVVFYGDYNYYMNTGYAPQFLTQQVHPGTASNSYNSFEVTRTYLDFRFTPIPGWTLRVTPNLTRDSSGNLFVRIKYAYLDKKDLFDGISYLKGDVLTAGQEPNPLIGWEEDMWGYRFVNLVPWNYMGLSSTYTGVSVHGPIRFNGKQYIDYDLGVFNNASFHHFERINQKQVMARLSFYPMGANSRFGGLGFTAFIDNGWGQPSGTNARHRARLFAQEHLPHGVSRPLQRPSLGCSGGVRQGPQRRERRQYVLGAGWLLHRPRRSGFSREEQSGRRFQAAGLRLLRPL